MTRHDVDRCMSSMMLWALAACPAYAWPVARPLQEHVLLGELAGYRAAEVEILAESSSTRSRNSFTRCSRFRRAASICRGELRPRSGDLRREAGRLLLVDPERREVGVAFGVLLVDDPADQRPYGLRRLGLVLQEVLELGLFAEQRQECARPRTGPSAACRRSGWRVVGSLGHDGLGREPEGDGHGRVACP